MKKRSILAIIMAAVLALSTVLVFAQENEAPEDAYVITARFYLQEENEYGFVMSTEDGEVVLYVNEDTKIVFEYALRLCWEDDYDYETTDNAWELLYEDQTMAELLDGRKLTVVMGYKFSRTPLSITILFESISYGPLPLDGDLNGEENGYVGIVTLPGEIDFDFEFDPPYFNGEVVVNNVIIEGAPQPFWCDENNVAMAPLRAIAEALGYEVTWNRYLQSVQLGVGIHLWIGSAEVHIGRMAPQYMSTEAINHRGHTFVPIDFFRNILNQTAYVFEGQFVVETYSDME